MQEIISAANQLNWPGAVAVSCMALALAWFLSNFFKD